MSTPSRGDRDSRTAGLHLESGGLNADKVLELTRNFDGDPTLRMARILLLQEVVTEPGLYFDARYDWVLIYGKKEGEWRGEGVLYHRSQGLHHHSKVHRHAISTTIRCQHSGAKTRLLSAHLPHHASLELTAVLLSDWGHGVPKGKVWLGIDANETFTSRLQRRGHRSHTQPGEKRSYTASSSGGLSSHRSTSR